MNEQQALGVLKDAIEGELSTSELRGASVGDIARALAARVVDEGWAYVVPVSEKVVETSQTDGISRRAELEGILDEVIGDLACGNCYGTSTKNIAIAAADRVIQGGWVNVVDLMPEASLEPADITIQRTDGSVLHFDESELSAETVKIVREAQWKDLPGLPSNAFEINNYGDIRIKTNKRILEKEPHGEVAIKINGFYHYINGPAIARELFDE